MAPFFPWVQAWVPWSFLATWVPELDERHGLASRVTGGRTRGAPFSPAEPRFAAAESVAASEEP